VAKQTGSANLGVLPKGNDITILRTKMTFFAHNNLTYNSVAANMVALLELLQNTIQTPSFAGSLSTYSFNPFETTLVSSYINLAYFFSSLVAKQLCKAIT